MRPLAKSNVEGRLRRMTGMSSEKLKAMHEAAEKTPWRVRCWKCRGWNEGLSHDLKICRHCEANLWSRDE